jgi:uncharacterized protein YcfJ
MKYILTVLAISVSLFATNVSAGTSVSIDGTVLSSTAIVQDVVREVPEKTCSIVEVPVYGKTQGTAADAIAGAIIGGVLGNQVGKGDGKDAATIFGAIIGAKVGEENGGKKQIVGYKQVEQCEIIYVRAVTQVVIGYETTVAIALGDGFDDFAPTFRTNRQYTVGTIVPVRMSLSLN